ncbi:hypothetical protein TIFTF001_008378 [Ficus carica]|uniref:Plastocyanin-like domain-containing protein n=1 Tax=Ficus carica TaxID=3494 RepID=A0AA88A8D8_FICCA|nr:hypothetical protein TIFTF001_008378 [Ficus carica]
MQPRQDQSGNRAPLVGRRDRIKNLRTQGARPFWVNSSTLASTIEVICHPEYLESVQEEFHIPNYIDLVVPMDNETDTIILQYKGVPNTVVPILPQLPAPNDTKFAFNYNNQLRSLNTPYTQLTTSLNNITFVMPKTGLLQAHYFNISGVFRADFPDRPPDPFNYTGAPLTANLGTSLGTRLCKVAYNSNPAKFNLVDPPKRNTVGVLTGGWTAIRFRANNPDNFWDEFYSSAFIMVSKLDSDTLHMRESVRS